jgi:nicotinamide-nucleotide amidase
VSLAVELLATGDELLTGQVVDTNSPWLMDRLWELGLMVRRKTLVGDDRGDLAAAVAETTSRADVVVLSGGMGPTEDDLTSEVVAGVLGVPLDLDEPSLRAIEERFQRMGRVFTPNNVKQARFPRGATIIPNRFGTAPGFSARVGRATLFCLPGVPNEYRGLCDEAVLPAVSARVGDVPASRVVKLIGVGESHADQALRPLIEDGSLGDVRWGFRAHWPEVHLKWSVFGPGAEARAAALEARVRDLFGDRVWGSGKEELPALLVARLAERGERLAVAESCTGGLVAELVTRVPGASAVFDLGVVAYANAAKERVVEVPAALLAAHGAVSGPVARALAEGVRRIGGAAWGIGITGIAGPTGGTPEKPVGTVHLAVAGADGTEHFPRLYRGDRDRVRRHAALEAIDLLRRRLGSR